MVAGNFPNSFPKDFLKKLEPIFEKYCMKEILESQCVILSTIDTNCTLTSGKKMKIMARKNLLMFSVESNIL